MPYCPPYNMADTIGVFSPGEWRRVEAGSREASEREKSQSVPRGGRARVNVGVLSMPQLLSPRGL